MSRKVFKIVLQVLGVYELAVLIQAEKQCQKENQENGTQIGIHPASG